MSANFMEKPRFRRNEMVRFMGGVGRIKHYKPDSNTWAYAVEMEMGPKPDFGRVGAETTIVLHESEIDAY